MSRRRVPIGWPRRDPRRCRFPLPNAVWDYELKPIEFVILSYLCCCQSHNNDGWVVPTEVIATAIHLTAGTVKKHLDSLVGRGLVTNGCRLAPALQLTEGKKFFSLPNEIFLLRLPPSAFMVYAYLLLIEDRKTHTCHPSYNTIAAATGLAKNTVMKSVGDLQDLRLITVERSWYFDQHGMKWNGNNLYTILPVNMAVDTFHRRQLHHLDLEAERRRVRIRQEEYERCRPRAALCATATAPNAPEICTPLCDR